MIKLWAIDWKKRKEKTLQTRLHNMLSHKKNKLTLRSRLKPRLIFAHPLKSMTLPRISLIQCMIIARITWFKEEREKKNETNTMNLKLLPVLRNVLPGCRWWAAWSPAARCTPPWPRATGPPCSWAAPASSRCRLGATRSECGGPPARPCAVATESAAGPRAAWEEEHNRHHVMTAVVCCHLQHLSVAFGNLNFIAYVIQSEKN